MDDGDLERIHEIYENESKSNRPSSEDFKERLVV